MPHTSGAVTNVTNSYTNVYNFPGCTFLRKDFGAKGAPYDDTDVFNRAIASIADFRGNTLMIEPGEYIANIIENKPGLRVEGMGVCSQGPGGQGRQVGVTIQGTTPGGYAWYKQRTTNCYYGGSFRNIAFYGTNVTAGGLRIEASYVTVEHCETGFNHTGKGIHVALPSGGDSCQMVKLLYCGSSNDFTAIEVDGGCNTLIDGCYNLKYSEGGTGIPGTGFGVVMHDNNSSIRGGKYEQNAVGIFSDATPGIPIIGVLFEGNTERNIKLYRPSGTNGTRHLIMCNTSSVHFGPFQQDDMLIGGDWQTDKLLNEGTNCKVLNTANWP